MLQEAIEMYKCGDTGKKYFTNNHIKAIFMFAFDVTPKSVNKEYWLIQFKKLYEYDAKIILSNHWQSQWWL